VANINKLFIFNHQQIIFRIFREWHPSCILITEYPRIAGDSIIGSISIKAYFTPICKVYRPQRNLEESHEIVRV
jgi:hypothetical protein